MLDGECPKKEANMNWNELFSYEKYTGFLFWKSKASIYSPIKLGRKVGCINSRGYLLVTVKFKKYQLHRIIWEMHNGPIPKGAMVDHVNGNILDNKIENLRLANGSQNLCNQGLGKRNKSGFKGVCWHKTVKRWVAQICFKGKIKQLGKFKTKEEAYAARVEAEKLYHGEFAQSLCRSA